MDSQTPSQHLEKDILIALEVYCVRLQGGESIEQLLKQSPEWLRSRLRKELITEHIQMRNLRDEVPKPEDYMDLFPGQSEILIEVFESALSDCHFSNDEASCDLIEPYPSETDPYEQFGKYKVVEKIGEGTFGQVFKCKDESSGSIVAVKVLKPQWAKDPHFGNAMRIKFANEARVMREFNHPNIIRVVDVDQCNVQGTPPYFAMEFIDGQTLRNLMDGRKLTLDESLEILLQITDALAHIHSYGKWHRDLKPENILLDRANKVYVTDFGLVLDDAQRLQSPRKPAGTYRYMSPKQVQGATNLLNNTIDFWAVGVIAYELLTGTYPFRGETRKELCNDILMRSPDAPESLNREIPERLSHLCMQCLERDDRARPRSADALRKVLLDQQRLRREAYLGKPANSLAQTNSSATNSLSSESKYPIPTLCRFEAKDAEIYLRLMPKSYDNQEGLPKLVAYWKQRILCEYSDRTFRIGIMVGVSGCGKSSLLQAGLVPQLPSHIKHVLIEASEHETEVRILSKLRQLFPKADSDQRWSLLEWTSQIGSGKLLPKGSKVVIILDQFEQWLNIHAGETTNDLLDALQKCDGDHLQAIVCVREGFYRESKRFVRLLNVWSLDEDSNYATAELFSAEHSRLVLEQFGRGLKRIDEPMTLKQRDFLDETIKELNDKNQGVVCVRLVMLAMVMSDRPWTVEELEKLGGLDGIGRQFFTDRFEVKGATEQNRILMPAAMRVLAILLPAEERKIKEIRSYNDLFRASELNADQFDDLLNILTRKLFLINQVEQDSGSSYELTHDFLIPSLRAWLKGKLGETNSGKAQLLLRERTSIWSAKPEKRNLPTIKEWVRIWWYTDRKKWTDSERIVMQQSGHIHATGLGLVVSAFIAIVVTAVLVQNQFLHKLEVTRVRGLIAQLVSAEPTQIPDIVGKLESNKKLAIKYLQPLLLGETENTDEKRSQLHARIASVGWDRAFIEPLLEELLTNKVAYVGPIRQQFRKYAVDLKQRLRAIMRDKKTDTERRFRAALALADYVPESEADSWEDQDLQFVVEQLVSFNAEFQPLLRENLRPISRLLIPDLEKIFEGSAITTDAQRLGAANAFADYAAKDVSAMTRLLAVANPEQFKVLFPLVAASHPPSTIESLRKVASTLPPADLGSVDRIRYGQRRANAAVALLRLGEREKVLPVFELTDDPEALTQFVFRCRDRGVRVEELLECVRIVSDGAVDRYPRNAQYALLLALGEYALEDIPKPRQAPLLAQLGDWYRTNPSSGVHGATGWLLRKWGRTDIVSEVDHTAVPYSVDREWFTMVISVSPTPKSMEESGEEDGAANPGAKPHSASEVAKSKNGSNEKLDDLASLEHPQTFYYTFIVFPSGESMIGSVEDELERSTEVKRELRHMVNLTRPFALLDREVTFDELIAYSPEFKEYMLRFQRQPSDAGFATNWYDSVSFCRWLSRQYGLSESDQSYADPESLDKNKYERETNPATNWAPLDWPLEHGRKGFRLPSESEWEIASRSGVRTAYGYGSEESLLSSFGWFSRNSGKQVHPPRELRPSVRGLFDMHGNLFEWTHDWYDDFGTEAAKDPLGPKGGSSRMNRGGCWNHVAGICRSAARNGSAPSQRNISYGFRLALSLPSGVSSPAQQGPGEELSGRGTERAQ